MSVVDNDYDDNSNKVDISTFIIILLLLLLGKPERTV